MTSEITNNYKEIEKYLEENKNLPLAERDMNLYQLKQELASRKKYLMKKKSKDIARRKNKKKFLEDIFDEYKNNYKKDVKDKKMQLKALMNISKHIINISNMNENIDNSIENIQNDNNIINEEIENIKNEIQKINGEKGLWWLNDSDDSLDDYDYSMTSSSDMDDYNESESESESESEKD